MASMSKTPTLADRFKALKTASEAGIPSDPETMPLEELAQAKIAFGEAKKGQTFAKVLEDSRYVTWFLGHYQDSTKPVHKAFVTFVRRQIEAQEAVVTSAPKSRAKAKAMPTSRPATAEEVDSWIAQEPLEMWDMIEEDQSTRQELEIQSQRLTRLEETMNQILQVLSQPNPILDSAQQVNHEEQEL